MPGTLAIDLGSTTTVVAWQDGTASPPRLLALAPYALDDPAVVPSLIWLTGPEGAAGALVGRQVLDAGLADGEGPGLLRDFKRRIGASPEPSSAGRSNGAPARAGGSQAEDSEGSEGPGDSEAAAQQPWLTPEAAGALLLQRIWRALPPGVEPDRLVLTAPIEAYRSYRQWLREVCGSFAVPELALVDEPTAAAIGAGLPPGSRVLVVDFGGGTLDLSLVQL